MTDDAAGKGPGITLAAVAALTGAIVGIISFFSTYVFVSKTEQSAHVISVTEKLGRLSTDQRLTDASLEQLSGEVKSLRVDQRLTNANLNKLLRRQSITPASREAMKIEMEDDDD